MAQPIRARLSWRNAAPVLASLIAVCWTLSGVDAWGAESAWLRGVVKLNVRTGPGTEYRILDGLKTGDHVEIQERRKGWIKVALDSGSSGWIPVGYLQSGPPTIVKLRQVEEEAAQLRETSAEQIRQLTELKELNQVLELVGNEGQLEIDRLRSENARLKANVRWPEWLTGAGIVFVGMILGAILMRTPRRRSPTRIRL